MLNSKISGKPGVFTEVFSNQKQTGRRTYVQLAAVDLQTYQRTHTNTQTHKHTHKKHTQFINIQRKTA